MSILKATALRYAEEGVPVFPCLPGDKRPATPHGYLDATTDRGKINEWWDTEPAYNVAISPEAAGWAVVDVDRSGLESWGLFNGIAGHTYTVRTRSGGLHVYYRGSLPATQRKIGPGIDTRGRGSYVLVPPSVVEGSPYSVETDCEMADLPQWITDLCTLKVGAAKRETTFVELDAPQNITRAKAFLARAEPAISGEGGNGRTYAVAATLLDLGLSAEKATELLQTEWNARCVPPWSDDELATLVGNASRYRQNDEGVWATEAPEETFGTAALSRAGLGKPAKLSRYHWEGEAEQDATKEPAWLLPGILPEHATALLYGATGSFKSFLAQDMGLCCATGQSFAGITPVKPGLVFYAAAEGRAGIKRARRLAWRVAHGIEGSIDSFFVGRTPLIADTSSTHEFAEEIAHTAQGRAIRLVILDTYAKCMAGLADNKAEDASKFVQFADELVETFGCTVLVLAHSGKEEGRGVRGSSALPAGIDTILEVTATRDTKSVALRVVQHKDADERAEPWHFQGKAVGQSLVFETVTAEEAASANPDVSRIDRKALGAALRDAGAYGEERGLTTNEAAELLEPGRVGDTAKALTRGAKKNLSAYCSGSGAGLRWHLPERKSA